MRIYVLVMHYGKIAFSAGYEHADGTTDPMSQSDSHYKNRFTNFNIFIDNAFGRWTSASYFPKENIVYLQAGNESQSEITNQNTVCYISGDLSYEDFNTLWKTRSIFSLKDGREVIKMVQQQEALRKEEKEKTEGNKVEEEKAEQEAIKKATIPHHTTFTSSKFIEFLVNPNNYFLLALAVLVTAIFLPQVAVAAGIAAGVFSGLGILSFIPFILRDFFVERVVVYNKVYNDRGNSKKSVQGTYCEGNFDFSYDDCPVKLRSEQISFLDYIFGAKIYAEAVVRERDSRNTQGQKITIQKTYSNEDYSETIGGLKKRLANYWAGKHNLHLSIAIMGFLCSAALLASFFAPTVTGFAAISPVFGLVAAPLIATFAGLGLAVSPVVATVIAAIACILAPLVLAHAVNRLIDNVFRPLIALIIDKLSQHKAPPLTDKTEYQYEDAPAQSWSSKLEAFKFSVEEGWYNFRSAVVTGFGNLFSKGEGKETEEGKGVGYRNEL